MARAQKGAEQLLTAAGLGEPAMSQVVQAILSANEQEAARSGTPAPARRAEATPAPPPAFVPPPVADASPAFEPPLSSPPVSPPGMNTESTEAPDELEVEDPPPAPWAQGSSPQPPVTPAAHDAAPAPDDEPGPDGEPEPDR
ncbi:MAG: hypothetical protein H0V45_06800 [Actinobacteria bacterium]|nr:hypothetical protein [Actinomycetota bacterium]